MRFTEQDYSYLCGESFSNGYNLKLEADSTFARVPKLLDLTRGASCIHVGCCDHIPLIEHKIQQGTWLHSLLEQNCSDVLGIDINQEAVDYVNQKGFVSKPVYCADITSDDFATSVPMDLAQFQYILFGEIIEHVDNPVLFLQRAKANLEEAGFYGTYIITTPNAFCMMRGGIYDNAIEGINSDHRYWFTPYTIAKVLVSAGLVPEELWFVNYGSYSIRKPYQSDQLIITGSARTQKTRGTTDVDHIDSTIHQLEAFLSAGDFSQALDYVAALPLKVRQHWQIQNMIGIICTYCRQFPEAETFFCAALEQEPNDANILYNLADTYAALGQKCKAMDMLRRCEENDREHQLAEDIASLREKLGEQKGGRVLMVAYYFPPLSGSGVFRSIKFAKYLPLFGWQPTVISADRPPNGWNFADDSLTAEIPSDMEVIRIPDLINTNRADSLSMERIQAVLQFLYGILRHSPEADQIFSQMTRSPEGIAQLFRFPCVMLSWAYDVVQYIEKNMDVDKFRVIYTTSGPRSAHLIGFYMKQKYGIPWVADYRDPWTFNAYGAEYDATNPKQKLLFELESILLHQADCNLTVEDGLIESYRKHFNLPKERIISITNGYDEEDFSALSVPKKQTEKFTICYSGLIYTHTQSLAPICSALKQLSNEKKINLSKINLCFVGATNKDNQATMKEFGLEGIFTHTGYVSHQEALQSNLDANILLLLVGDEDKFKPIYTGKIFEYLRSGRPILALAPKGGVVDQILRESGHGQAFLSMQITEIKDMILQEYRKWEKGQISVSLHSPVIERFERKVLTEQLANVLSGAVKQHDPLPSIGSGTPAGRGPKYLVICNGGYPTEDNPRCMFAHERVLQYIKAGLNVEAFGFIWDAPSTQYKFDGVDVTQGGAPVLRDLLQKNQYEKLLIHCVDTGVMYAIQEAGKLNMPMIIWCHGYEVQPWYRCWFNYSPAQIEHNKDNLDKSDNQRRNLLKQIYSLDNIHFIFVSTWQMDRSKKFVGNLPKHCDVIHNYINYEFFASPAKKSDDRFHILSIKNHARRTYANDLTAKAILELSRRDFFPQLTFELYGDGILFENNFGELIKRNFPNVHIYRKFLSHDEMRDLFRSNGIFLSPTRMDSHQITTSEAMAAGMSVITSSAGPTREFLNEDCGSLFEFDNYWMMAEEIEYLYLHPDEFLRKSKNAVQRIRTQCGYDQTIGRELQLITGV